MAIAVDASTPARATGNTTQAVTTATFSPPANSLLVACTSASAGSNSDPTVAITDNNGGFTWTQVGRASKTSTSSTGISGGVASIHVAPLVAGATNLSVTATQTNGSSPTSLKIYVLTGTLLSGTTFDGSTIGFSTANDATTTAFTSTSTAGLLVVSATEWTAPGTAPTSADTTYDAYTQSTNLDGLSGYRAITAIASQTADLHCAGTSAAQWLYVTAEILPSLTGLPRPPMRVLQAVKRASTF